uniref:5-formyltetrahydrofolate cyclo-ligase n=3 Tax=Cacopsylla melanoneura TaxID=428564 RepID=A0A8D8LVB0_9HEMI
MVGARLLRSESVFVCVIYLFILNPILADLKVEVPPGIMSANVLNVTKKELRANIAKLIKRMIPKDKESESALVCERFLNHPAYRDSKRISIYVDISDEIGTKKIINDICNSGRECFIPRYEKSDMKMLKLKCLEDLDSLDKNKENILQHSLVDDAEDAMKTGGLDLVVVPGRAFTLNGKRCGRGKGYYDKYLRELKKLSPHCKTVGLAFGCQIVHDLPMDEHDEPLDYVIHPRP